MTQGTPDHGHARWYFGWNIVAAATGITLLTVGLRMGMGPFFIPLVEDLGISRTSLATIVAVGMLAYGVGMPFAGHLAQTRGTRFVLLLGLALTTVSILWSVMATGPVSFMLSFGILLSLGLAFTSPVALTPILSRWFTRRRGKALFFLSTGSMAGIAVMTPVLTLAIETQGWRATLIGFNLLFLVLVVPLALTVMRDTPPADTDLRPGDAGSAPPLEAPLAALRSGEAMRTVHFIRVALGLFACGFSMNLLGSHGVPMLVDHGFTPVDASLGIGLIGLVAIPSTLVLGHLADRVSRRSLLAAIYLIRALGFVGLMMVMNTGQLFAVAALAGVVWAGSIALSSAILADFYGIRTVGVLYGWAYLGHQVGAMLSSWLGGWGFERYGTHWVAFGAAAVVLVIAGLVSLRLPASARCVTRLGPSTA